MPNRQDYVDATNAALGVLGSKARGQDDDAESLLRAFTDDGTMTSGFMLAAELIPGELETVAGACAVAGTTLWLCEEEPSDAYAAMRDA